MTDQLLKSLFAALLPHWHLFALLLALWILVKICRSPIVKGWWGEYQVNRGLRSLESTDYRCFADLYLPRPDGGGTTQLDHVVVSPFGIFVIETKNFQGWIFGTAKQPQWTQQIYRHKSKFQNPLHQNLLHAKALAEFLSLPADRFHSVVMFMGGTTFKTPMPDNVIDRGLLTWIKARQTTLIDHAAFTGAVERLTALVASTHRPTAKREHLAQLRARGK